MNDAFLIEGGIGYMYCSRGLSVQSYRFTCTTTKTEHKIGPSHTSWIVRNETFFLHGPSVSKLWSNLSLIKLQVFQHLAVKGSRLHRIGESPLSVIF